LRRNRNRAIFGGSERRAMGFRWFWFKFDEPTPIGRAQQYSKILHNKKAPAQAGALNCVLKNR
jgi:hypothetical protein